MEKDRKIQSLNSLPNSLEAGYSVIGGLILDNRSWDQVADILTTNDFYNEQNKLIFSSITELSNENIPFDVITINKKLNGDKSITAHLTDIVKNTPSSANIKAYANIIREQSILRQLIEISKNLIEDSYSGSADSKILLDEAEKKIFNITDENLRIKSGFREMNTLLKDSVERIEELSELGDSVTGLATGFNEFDESTTGLQNGVAGRPSMGKTTFAMNLAEYASLKNDASTAIFSMEMSGSQLSARFISSMGRINQQKIRTGKLTDEDWPRLTNAVSLLSKAKIFIDDTPALSPNDIRARARRLQREKGNQTVKGDLIKSALITSTMGVSYKLKLPKNI